MKVSSSRLVKSRHSVTQWLVTVLDRLDDVEHSRPDEDKRVSSHP
ncbi:hypothetical protein [Steroidobacter gossypii]|nr:hypothetical protein [Steroidobacter gossypii]